MRIFSGPLTPPGKHPRRGDLVPGRFYARPNRFLVLADTDRGIVRAHCPNPGRLWEIFLPGTPLLLQYAGNPERATPYTLVAAKYEGKILPLYAAGANAISRELILPRLFPGARKIRREVTVRGSRFDFEFYLPHSGGERRNLAEVKACTLTEEGLAMFPDAPTERGRRHLEELALLAQKKEAEGHIIFVLHHPDTRAFMPNFHTDPAFALTMEEVSPDLTFHAVSVGTDETGRVNMVDPNLPVLTAPTETIRKNCGVYMILLERKVEAALSVGALGKRLFPAGWYVYVGRARKNLSQRIKRHLRNRKKKHWHIDYILEGAEGKKEIPIYTERDRECLLAGEVGAMADSGIPGCGCSDCGCASHLFYFSRPPLTVKPFVRLIFRYRHRLCFESPLPFQNSEN